MDQVSTYLPGILLAYATFFLAIAGPGPNVLAIIGTSLSVGRRSGIALALGVAAGSFGWAMLAAVGLTARLASYAAPSPPSRSRADSTGSGRPALRWRSARCSRWRASSC